MSLAVVSFLVVNEAYLMTSNGVMDLDFTIGFTTREGMKWSFFGLEREAKGMLVCFATRAIGGWCRRA